MEKGRSLKNFLSSVQKTWLVTNIKPECNNYKKVKTSGSKYSQIVDVIGKCLLNNHFV